MEDAHTAELQLDQDNRPGNAFFAVYDGHGGEFSLVVVLLVVSSRPPFNSVNVNRSVRC